MPVPPVNHIESEDPTFFALADMTYAVWGGWAALSIGGYVFFGEVALLGSLLGLGLLLARLILRTYHRQQIESFHHYRQIEALTALYRQIEPRYPLPPMRLWVISPDFAVLLAGVIQQHRPTVIVELGSGTSTLISAYSLEKIEAGRVIAFEHMDEFAQGTRRSLNEHGLEAQVIHAPLRPLTLPEGTWQWYDTRAMNSLPAIDLLVVDGPPDGTQKLARYPALPILYDRLADGALILVDDFIREDEHEMVNRWLEEYPLDVVATYGNEKGAALLRKAGARPVDRESVER
jgi:predicted O-methyltransferase YrrM